jgi:GPH family glycoside/pentoside/hexuronide:cation symporter
MGKLSPFLSYSFVGFILSISALPLYIATPSIYAGLGQTIFVTGMMLMIIRLVDAFTDPVFGRLIDKTTGHRFLKWLNPSLIFLASSVFFLFNPPEFLSQNSTLVFFWFFIFTLIVSISNGIANIAYQSWAFAWSSQAETRNKLISGREVFVLIGLIVSSVLIALESFAVLSLIIFLSSIVSVIWLLLIKTVSIDTAFFSTEVNKRNFNFFSFESKRMKLFLVLCFFNTFANSIPALLFVFFFSDALLLGKSEGGILLSVYFLAAAISIPFWRKTISKIGNKQTWFAALTLSIVFFITVLFLEEGHFYPFLFICAITGVALGGELISAPAVLNDLIPPNRNETSVASTYFGIWSLVNKIAIALASGFCLPLLGIMGYDPNLVTETGQSSLMFMYAGAPCVIKLVCMILLGYFIKKANV